MSSPFIGPLPYAEIPAQPRFSAWCLDWTAYDVPRIWDIVREEDSPRGWEQISGFRQLSQLLVDHYRRLLSQHFDLSQAWQSPAAEAVLSRVDSFAQSLLSDANCAMTTAHALDRIMTTYADARVQVSALEQEWNRITTDWVPEWWDDAAIELNTKAQAIMEQTDAAVRDHRTNIIIPRTYLESEDPGTSIETGHTSDNKERWPQAQTRVPPLPGYQPVSMPGRGGAELASMPGAPGYVPAVPGQPVSMLPIPPGSQLAPYGGAYILPGPGIGRAGYAVPMPHAPRGSGGGYGGPGGRLSTSSTAGGSGMGLMPMSIGSPSLNNNMQGSLYRRSPDTAWHVEKGVPPIIEGIADDEFVLDQPSEKQEEAFKEWFAELAHPWRSEDKNGSEPHVVLRKVVE